MLAVATSGGWAWSWVAVGGLAQIAAALATVYLALKTRKLAEDTKKLAEDTKEEAVASKALADEAKIDRELSWRPQLGLLTLRTPTPTPTEPDRQTLRSVMAIGSIRNAGGGPAIDCHVVLRNPTNVSEWSILAFGDLAPGSETVEAQALTELNHNPPHLFSGLSGSTPDPMPDVLLFCSDVLGRRWRFPVRVYPKSGSNEIDPPELWKRFPTDHSPPGGNPENVWSIDPLIWEHA